MSKPDNRPTLGTIIDGRDSHAYRVLEYREPLDGSYLHEMIVERLTGQDKGEHYGIKLKSVYTYFRVLDEHYAVCNQCGELPPCSGEKAQRAVERSVEAMKLPDGYCPACKEPITHRQKKHLFPGPNLLKPVRQGRRAVPSAEPVQSGCSRVRRAVGSRGPYAGAVTTHLAVQRNRYRAPGRDR